MTYMNSRTMMISVFWAVLLLTGLACGPGPELSENAVKLKKVSLVILTELSDKARDSARDENTGQADEILEKMYPIAQEKVSHKLVGLAVFNRKGVLLAGRFPAKDGSGGSVKVPAGQDYSSYQHMKNVFEKGRTSSCLLYGQGGEELLTVCMPILENKKVRGGVCLGYTGAAALDFFGLGKDEFLKIDFSR